MCYNDHKVKLTCFQQSLVLDIKLKHKKHDAAFRNYNSGGRKSSKLECVLEKRPLSLNI